MTHSLPRLLIGFVIAGLAVAGLASAVPKGAISGGGSGLKVREATIEGRRYFIIKRDASTFEVFSPDDPDAWLIFDANTGPIAQGPKGSDVDRDMRKFPKDLFS